MRGLGSGDLDGLRRTTALGKYLDLLGCTQLRRRLETAQGTLLCCQLEQILNLQWRTRGR